MQLGTAISQKAPADVSQGHKRTDPIPPERSSRDSGENLTQNDGGPINVLVQNIACAKGDGCLGTSRWLDCDLTCENRMSSSRSIAGDVANNFT
jgi:hypothetical protein